ncbi:MAG: tetratricopeptide repeat protein [Aquabacterium sp.]|nr:tetratricopeptide repeat protein [Aquabacterium sp.]
MSSAIDQLKTQLRQLDELARSGALPEDQAQAAKARLERQLLEAVMTSPDSSASTPGDGQAAGVLAPASARLSPKVLWSMVAFVAAVGAGGYALVGTPEAWHVEPAGNSRAATSQADGKGSQDTSGAPHTMKQDQINAMVDGLVAKLKAQPQNAEGWAMLARTYAALKRFDEALPAYRQAIEQRPDDAQLYADYADALAVTQGRTLEGEPTKLVAKALSLDANNFKALSLSGTIAYDKQDFKAAAALWERAVQHAPADNPELARQMQSALDDARQRAGLPAQQAAPAPAPPPGEQRDIQTASGGTVSGMVSLAKELAGKVSPEDTVFIFAKAAQGPKMPLAIVRKQVKDLPYRFELTDAMAMAPQFKLSGFSDVVVGARVSRSGEAMPQPGDWSGQSQPVKVGTQGMEVRIQDAVR